MIFVSTGGVKDQTAAETARMWMKSGMSSFELSGGRHSENVEGDLLGLHHDGANLILHNYFPPPDVPFVFNLASNDCDIAERSIKHVESAIQLSSKLGATFFSFHGGFLIDPQVQELGNQISRRTIFQREKATALFVERVAKLSEAANANGITLLVENNVLSENNFNEFGQNPLLMVSEDEIEEVMRLLPSTVGLLIDVGHLRVSAKTLGFDPIKVLKRNNLRVHAYHLSDNDGKSDSNGPFSRGSWFWDFLDSEVSFATVEVYSLSASELLEQLNIAHEKLPKLLNR